MRTVFLTAVVAFAGIASAQSIHINHAGVTASGPFSDRFTATYRLSESNNWDQSLAVANGGTTTVDLGGVPDLNDVVLRFTLTHVVGGGLSFRLADTRTPRILADGFLSSTASIDPYNSLLITAEARKQGQNDGRLALDQLSFVGGTSFHGAFAHPSLANASAAHAQRLLSSQDLSTFAWTLTGTVKGFRGLNGVGGQEAVKFEVRGQRAEGVVGIESDPGQPVPEPFSLGLMAAGLAGAWRRRARRA